MQAHPSTHMHAHWAEAAPWLALLLTLLLTLLLAFGLALCSGPQSGDPGDIPFPLAGTQLLPGHASGAPVVHPPGAR